MDTVIPEIRRGALRNLKEIEGGSTLPHVFKESFFITHIKVFTAGIARIVKNRGAELLENS